MTCKDFKNLSLNQLRGKWGKAIIALFVATLVVMAVSIVVNFPAQMTANLISNILLINRHYCPSVCIRMYDVRYEQVSPEPCKNR